MSGEPYRLKYVGGLEAVEENYQVVSKGGVVELTDADRAADLVTQDDWELVGDRRPRHTKAAREAAAEAEAPPPAEPGG